MSNSGVVYIDVREPDEFNAGHVTGAINIPLSVFQSREAGKIFDSISTEAHIVVYCRSGARASIAEGILKQKGFRLVSNGINQLNIEQ